MDSLSVLKVCPACYANNKPQAGFIAPPVLLILPFNAQGEDLLNVHLIY